MVYKKFRNSLNKKLTYSRINYYKRKFIENRKKSNNIDETIKNNFKNNDIQSITNKFAISFNENINKILHICNQQVLEYDKTRLTNSLYLSPTCEDEIFYIF